MNIIRSSFVFYGDWLNTIKDLPKDVQLDIYQAIADNWLEEAAKNTSKKVLAKIKEYQQPKQAVLF